MTIFINSARPGRFIDVIEGNQFTEPTVDVGALVTVGGAPVVAAARQRVNELSSGLLQVSALRMHCPKSHRVGENCLAAFTAA